MKTVPALLCTALLFVASSARAQPVETEIAGVTAEVVELRQSRRRAAPGRSLRERGCEDGRVQRYAVDRIVLVDVKSKKKHFPLKDANGQYIGGPIGEWMTAGASRSRSRSRQATVLWAYFEPVRAGQRDDRRGAVRIPVRERAGDRRGGQGVRERHRRDAPRPGRWRPSSRRNGQTRS